jgi:hypothetical protein
MECSPPFKKDWAMSDAIKHGKDVARDGGWRGSEFWHCVYNFVGTVSPTKNHDYEKTIYFESGYAGRCAAAGR